ncbi:hypothetical protein C3B55_00185 [Candidatus Pseudomonas adelgestsugas]|uniref:Uncharacterized protein n=1 Tax=Candidatus Pseudomonas adelgestsugas TaxID=1302376 RepID=A0ABX5R7D1_9PSED|nr:hypothetical protein C3B55_00185 [Candidatus Pseudomonas adelgestsugas]
MLVTLALIRLVNVLKGCAGYNSAAICLNVLDNAYGAYRLSAFQFITIFWLCA